jgi:hypothetical protein
MTFDKARHACRPAMPAVKYAAFSAVAMPVLPRAAVLLIRVSNILTAPQGMHLIDSIFSR